MQNKQENINNYGTLPQIQYGGVGFRGELVVVRLLKNVKFPSGGLSNTPKRGQFLGGQKNPGGGRLPPLTCPPKNHFFIRPP